MNDYQIDNGLVTEVREQFRLWALFLNNGIGLFSFTLGLASLGTDIPWLSALFSTVVIFLIRWQGKHYFPPKVKELREDAKKNDKAKILLKGLESEFLSFKTLFIEYPVFIFGLSFLLIILMSPLIVKAFPVLGGYFGI